MEFVRATVDLASVAAPILLLALRSAAVMAFFSPVSRFRAGLTYAIFFFGILAFIPGLHFWCCFSCSACLFSSSLSPGVASLGCFACWPSSLVVTAYLFGFSFYNSSAVSSSSPPAGGWGRLLLSLFWCVCSAFSWGSCGFPLRVMRLGFHTWLTPVGCPTPAVVV